MKVTKQELRQIVREAVKDRLGQLDESVDAGVSNDASMAKAALTRLIKAAEMGDSEGAQSSWRQANFYLTAVRRRLESV